VSKQRLEAMLDNEWAQLLTQLQKARGSRTRFFSFVDTVSARNFAGTNDPHGWIGFRFQSQPGGPPNDVLMHINLLDRANILQQEAIGILGVNLIYAVFYELQTKKSFLEGVAQDVVKERIEIDYIDLRGPVFESWNGRTLLRSFVRVPFGIDQQGKHDAALLAKQPSIIQITQSDRGQRSSCLPELVLLFAQLRNVLAAENSAIVP
jgi:hypothetical protein